MSKVKEETPATMFEIPMERSYRDGEKRLDDAKVEASRIGGGSYRLSKINANLQKGHRGG